MTGKAQVTKKELAQLMGGISTEDLRKDLFSDLWLKVFGWDEATYKVRRKFTIEETRQIYAMLQVRGLKAF